jgi:hypothetical protein
MQSLASTLDPSVHLLAVPLSMWNMHQSFACDEEQSATAANVQLTLVNAVLRNNSLGSVLPAPQVAIAGANGLSDVAILRPEGLDHVSDIIRQSVHCGAVVPLTPPRPVIVHPPIIAPGIATVVAIEGLNFGTGGVTSAEDVRISRGWRATIEQCSELIMLDLEGAPLENQGIHTAPIPSHDLDDDILQAIVNTDVSWTGLQHSARILRNQTTWLLRNPDVTHSHR